MGSRGAEHLDAKLIAAWNEIPEAQQFNIRTALLKPERLGAIMPLRNSEERQVKTSLGYVVHSGFVTPLARALIEAVDWNGEAEPAKPKRARRAKEAA